MRAAAIDIGSNSIKMVVGESDGVGGVTVLTDTSVITRLIDKMESGSAPGLSNNLDPAARARAIEALRAQVRTARELGATKIKAAATSAVRDAADQSAFANTVESELGISLEVLTEQREAELSYAAVAADPELTHSGPAEGLAVVDIGGGSTELAFGNSTAPDFSRSLRLGAVRVTEKHLKSDPPRASELAAAAAEIESVLREGIGDRKSARLVGVGGSIVNLGRILHELPPETTGSVHGISLTRANVASLVDRLAGMTTQQRTEIIGLDPKRADIIVGGALILQLVMTVLEAEELLVSTRGLRYGLLYEMLRGEI